MTAKRRWVDWKTLAWPFGGVLAWTAASCLVPKRGMEAESVPEISTSTPFTGDKFVWPPGKKAAVSLTYDDALLSQLNNAAPALADHHLHATFFLTDVARNEADRWKALGKHGHELAAHTMLHPCDGAQSWVKKGNALQDYNATRMEAELNENVSMLKSFGVKDPITFAYPCGSTWIGESQESYTPLVRKHFFAARGTAPTFAIPATELFDNAPAVSGDKSGEELVKLVQGAVDDGAWLIVMFHGVGGDFLTVDLGAHETLLAYLEKHKEVWTDTFVRVSSYVMSHRPPLAAPDAGAAD
jgi:peptidoglycan/xylan/chitin deacetylase (PgdA/CDA1 family)